MYKGLTKEFYGEKLYKYYSYNTNNECMFAPVINKNLRYRRPESFNDPYDCYLCARVNGSIQSIRKNQMQTVFVCCLTTSYDDMLMWSHYASNHQGFVVEYDTEKLKAINEQQIEIFSEVIYSDEVVTRNLFSNGNDGNKVVEAIFHKARCWNYEKEVRSAFYSTPDEYIFFKDIPLPSDAITSVILGSHFISKNKGIPYLLKGWYDKNMLHYMQLCSDKYKLEKMSDLDEKWFIQNNL